jgi:4-amino-4-deoxy-L-arabinose transferase-like glycosyltransferase
VSQLAKLVAVLYVFAGSLAILCWSAGDAAIATPYVDPVAKIQAHEEAVTAAASFEIAAHGGWLTPRVFGLPLSGPPLQTWLQSLCAKFFGPTVWAARLPSLFAGAGTTALVFAWLVFEANDLAAALVGAVLILSSHLFFTLSRLGLPDALLTFWITLAMFALSRSPRLASAAALWTFGVASGAAFLTGGIAGLLPLLALVLFCAMSRHRLPWPRLPQTVAIGMAIAAPWYVRQLAAHGPWFQAHFAPQESSLWFYPKRLLFLDAPLLAVALLALLSQRSRLLPVGRPSDSSSDLPMAVQNRDRKGAEHYPSAGDDLLAWILATFIALVFQPADAPNLLPVLPALAILAAGAVPVARAKWALALATAVFAVKLFLPAQPWGIPWDPEVMDPSDAALARYTALHRGNELIVVQPDDHVYSVCLLLPHVRYVFEPTQASLGPLLGGHPDSDFFLPAVLLLRDQSVHQVLPMRGARAFLLARKMIHRP